MSIEQAREFVSVNRPVCLWLMGALSQLSAFDKAPNPWKGLKDLNEKAITDRVLVVLLWYMSYTKEWNDETVRQFLVHMNNVRNKDKTQLLTKLDTYDSSVQFDLKDYMFCVSDFEVNLDCITPYEVVFEPQSGIEGELISVKSDEYYHNLSNFTKVSIVATSATVVASICGAIGLPIGLAIIKQTGQLTLLGGIYDIVMVCKTITLNNDSDNSDVKSYQFLQSKEDYEQSITSNQFENHEFSTTLETQSGMEDMESISVDFMKDEDARAYTRGTRPVKARDTESEVQRLSQIPTGHFTVQLDNKSNFEGLNGIYQRSYGNMPNSSHKGTMFKSSPSVGTKDMFSHRPSNCGGL